jgi:hypothetical protein
MSPHLAARSRRCALDLPTIRVTANESRLRATGLWSRARVAGSRRSDAPDHGRPRARARPFRCCWSSAAPRLPEPRAADLERDRTASGCRRAGWIANRASTRRCRRSRRTWPQTLSERLGDWRRWRRFRTVRSRAARIAPRWIQSRRGFQCKSVELRVKSAACGNIRFRLHSVPAHMLQTTASRIEISRTAR